MPVERSLGHAGLRDDAVDAYDIEALLREEFVGGAEDALARLEICFLRRVTVRKPGASPRRVRRNRNPILQTCLFGCHA